ncbi:hypothetical protein KUF71_010626 [Frankliniella fusca]|uniref:Uncharacterized protein n=1 Tax=Frankliniella fusca TaxID=407009 RepID=A0AAE1LIG4_9NEOP|nr:hypothetical protein KUF71_010626 [Frankliniella fusca]
MRDAIILCTKMCKTPRSRPRPAPRGALGLACCSPHCVRVQAHPGHASSSPVQAATAGAYTRTRRPSSEFHPLRKLAAMEVLARTVLVLLVTTAAVLSAPSALSHGRVLASGEPEQNAPGEQPQKRVTRQAPGADILTRLSEAFREKMQQKCGGASPSKMPNLLEMLSSLGINVPVPHIDFPQGIVNMAKDVAAEEAEAEAEEEADR